MIKDIIVILGGALKIDKNGMWRTANFSDRGDNFGICGNRLRVLAAGFLYKDLPDQIIVVSGGKGQLKDILPGKTTLASIIEGELVELGISSKEVIKEEESGNTFQQLKEVQGIIKNRRFKKITLISNKYHLTRIRAMLNYSNELKLLNDLFNLSKLKLKAAEDIVMRYEPRLWHDFIMQAYKRKEMKKRIEMEKLGVAQIKNGTYKIKTNYSGKIRTAVIGLGNITWAYEDDPAVMKRMDYPTHRSVLAVHPKFELVAVQDISIKAREAFTKKYPQTKIYKNWEEMIKKEEPDLLVVASNTPSHIEICNRAIDLGVKSILCEKPVGYSLKESEKLINKAEKKKCEIFVNYLRAFNSSYQDIIAKISSGHLGRIQSFDVKYTKGIFNNGTHMIDLLLRMFGDIKKIYGFGDPTRRLKEADPTLSAVLEFENGVSGYIHGLNNDFYGILELDILGEAGRMKMVDDKTDNNFISIKSGLYPVYDNIYSCISSGDFTKNSCSGKESLRSLRIADNIVKSVK